MIQYYSNNTMATYFHGSSDSRAAGDGSQTQIIMNPNAYSVGFSGTQPPRQQYPPPAGSNFLFFNNSDTSVEGNSVNFLHPPPLSLTQQQLVGIPLTSSAASPHDRQLQQHVSPYHAFLPCVTYNSYSQPMDLEVAREAPRSQQGLSLSLSSETPAYGSFRTQYEVHSQPLLTATSPTSDSDVRISTAGGSSPSASGISNYVSGMQSVLLNSKYLKAAQELLDEVVNVNKGVKVNANSASGDNGLVKNIEESSPETASAGDGQSIIRENGGKPDTELTTAERQEIQMKKAKLVKMLDEVEQRYRQYHDQMHIVITWFEQAGGIGSAKTYTALALQTISKQFRCLKDAILGQARAASKRLGEEDSLGGKTEGSRLKFIDNHLRQQRALQQLGMIQHNAWRPQRGLPERSVSVLRAWLFEHFLHPYPKESDKLMLAEQTGLTRSQVCNWFINARVRLWKPMVEEMYEEEMKEQEKKAPEENSGKSQQIEDSSKTTAPPEKTSSLENQSNASVSNQNYGLNPNADMEIMTQGSPKKQRPALMLHSPISVPSMNMDESHADLKNENLCVKFGTEAQSREGFSLLGEPTNFIEGFGSYAIAELGRFSAEQLQAPYSGTGFSLTLGLPQRENLIMSGSHSPFLPNQNIHMDRGVEIGQTTEYGNINTPTTNHSTGVYENINVQGRKRCAAQLLPDFVS